MMGSIWGNEPRYIPHEEHDMTDINMGLVVEADMEITHAAPEPEPEPEETVEGE